MNGAAMSRGICAGFMVLAQAAAPAHARITRIEIASVQSPTFEGASFGTAGRYEKLAGRFFGEVDPNDPLNVAITDIKLAPRNARGMVEYSGAILIIRPVDPTRGNHRLLFEVNNRGNILSFGLLNDAAKNSNDPSTAADAGNGFMMRQGYTLVMGRLGRGFREKTGHWRRTLRARRADRAEPGRVRHRWAEPRGIRHRR